MMLIEEMKRQENALLVNVNIDGMQLPALVDTGASSTFIDENVFKTFPGNAASLQPYTGNVTTANGCKLSGIRGEVHSNISLTLQRTTKVILSRIIVTDSLQVPVVIGTSLLKQAGILINMENMSLRFNTGTHGAMKNTRQAPETTHVESETESVSKRPAALPRRGDARGCYDRRSSQTQGVPSLKQRDPQCGLSFRSISPATAHDAQRNDMKWRGRAAAMIDELVIKLQCLANHLDPGYDQVNDDVCFEVPGAKVDPPQKRTKKQKQKQKCYFCDKSGHVWANCKKRMAAARWQFN